MKYKCCSRYPDTIHKHKIRFLAGGMAMAFFLSGCGLFSKTYTVGKNLENTNIVAINIAGENSEVHYLVKKNGEAYTVTETKQVSEEVYDKFQKILENYEWQEYENLPKSEEFAMDAATRYLSFTFEPYDNWGIDSDKDLTKEASQMWREIEKLLEQ